jgi:hypothetical protein
MFLALENVVNDGARWTIVEVISRIGGRWFSGGWRINMVLNDW